MGMIDKKGEYVIGPDEYSISYTQEIYYCKTKTSELKYFDLDGKEIIPHY